MKKLLPHFLSIAAVGVLFLVLILQVSRDNREVADARAQTFEPYLALIDPGNPLEKAMLQETLDHFAPAKTAENAESMRQLEIYRRDKLARQLERNRRGSGDRPSLPALLGMYALFLLVYSVVMMLTYYGVQVVAILKFVQMKRGRESYLQLLVMHLRKTMANTNGIQWPTLLATTAGLLGRALLKGLLYLMLFSPAYVLAYAMKTRIDTDTLFFMVVLGVISNGLLITYGHKFFTFLVTEDRRGYVQTAIVKNLSTDYSRNPAGGIPLSAVFRLRKQFDGHVFGHVFMNARYQYLATLKEQASFLITGLVIIEMALNIQGHLCYELLQSLLFHRYDIALLIIFGIFLAVKATDILTDGWMGKIAKRYENVGI